MTERDRDIARIVGKIKYQSPTDEKFTNNIAQLAQDKPDFELSLPERQRLYRMIIEQKRHVRNEDKETLEYAQNMLIVVTKQIEHSRAIKQAASDRIEQGRMFEEVERAGLADVPIIPGDPMSTATHGSVTDPEGIVEDQGFTEKHDVIPDQFPNFPGNTPNDASGSVPPLH